MKENKTNTLQKCETFKKKLEQEKEEINKNNKVQKKEIKNAIGAIIGKKVVEVKRRSYLPSPEKREEIKQNISLKYKAMSKKPKEIFLMSNPKLCV
jgi:hypothetical protein